MKRLVFALLILGMGVVSYGLETSFTKLIVLKGTAADTLHYVLNDPNPTATAAQRATYGVDALALAAKPKVFYFLVVEVTYTPQIVAGKWTGEGRMSIAENDFWTMGAVEYGIGRHDANGVWQPKLAYAYDVGAAAPFLVGLQYWNWTKAKVRTGDAIVLCKDAANTFSDSRDGVADLVYSAKLVTDRASGKSWYDPSVASLTISYTQWMQQKIGTPADWRDVQVGAGKVVFKQDAAMTTKANLNNGATPPVNTGLALVAADINAFLVKGKYPAVTPNLDPDGLYAP